MIKHILSISADVNDGDYVYTTVEIESDKELDAYINLIRKLRDNSNSIDILFDYDYDYDEQLKELYPDLDDNDITRLNNIIPYSESNISYNICYINHYEVLNKNRIL